MLIQNEGPKERAPANSLITIICRLCYSNLLRKYNMFDCGYFNAVETLLTIQLSDKFLKVMCLFWFQTEKHRLLKFGGSSIGMGPCSGPFRW